MTKLNSLFVWYPLIKDIVPTPKTIMIPMQKDFESYEKALDSGDDPEMQHLIQEAIKAVKLLGGYPVFMRSDETSNKHEWKNTCYVTDDESMKHGIKNILEFTLMVFGNLGFNGVVVREFLDLPHEFHAFSGMPVSQEFRFFIKNGQIICRHPYWFPSCMQRVDCEDWLPKLRKIQILDSETQKILDNYAIKISKVVESLKAPDNYWSVDFCYAKEKGCLFTDMALGVDSYHYSTCPNAPEEMKHYPDPEDLSEVTTIKGIKDKAKKLKQSLKDGTFTIDQL